MSAAALQRPRRRCQPRSPWWLPLWCAGCAVPVGQPAALTDLGQRVVAQCGGETFAEYRRENPRRPVIWPLYAPGGIAVTRAFPLAQVAGEPRDHPEQESLWFGHGDVNGVDFWQGHSRIVEVESSVDASNGALSGVSSWRWPDGREVGRDFHRYTFTGGGEWRAIDIDITLVASDGDLVLGDCKDGTLGLRLRPELCLRGGAAKGSIRNSEGQTDLDVWGKRARWVAYAGEVEGQFVVVAVFDHPQNHGHPTYWHARDYGLLAANPFALHDFTGSAKGSGAVTIPAGGQLRSRHRVWIARGRERLGEIDGAWRTWAAAP